MIYYLIFIINRNACVSVWRQHSMSVSIISGMSDGRERSEQRHDT